MNYQQGLVSIVTPVYNAERFIEQTIQSVLAQTYTDWELLLIDDCSTDNSGNIIQRYAEQDERIKYHRLQVNSGAAVARNTAIGLAQGEYLAFLDSDDLWVSNKLERQLSYMKANNAAFVFARIRMIDRQGNILKENVPIPSMVNYKTLLKRTVIATSTVLLDRKRTGNFAMPLRRGGQDYATWLLILRKIDFAYGLDECLVEYRVSDNSLSSKKKSSVRQVYEIQTQDEHIGKIHAIINTCCFCLYAFKKHYL